MHRALPFFIPAAVLVAAGALLIVMGRLERQLVDARREFLTLQFDRAAETAGRLGEPGALARWLPGFAARQTGAGEQHAAAAYWTVREGRASNERPQAGPPDPADARLRLVAANGAYRRVDFNRDQRRLLQDLREVIDAYGDVLKQNPWQFDAAYNYQYVARVWATLARSAAARRSAPLPPAAAPPFRTIHGRAGAESPGLQMNEFKVIVPHQSDERREEQEAGKSAPQKRKG
jgi:hypothetical protein